ncbi:MAG: arginine--tRNA ligase [Clostridiaceae bacterium]|nr:arginine--tRNA ligase [Clostridiaceae bacterium]MDY5991468.1 arginine--tRNA ligase [Oscillospiraceae bacterium]
MELTTQKVHFQIEDLIAKAVEKAFSAGVLPASESAPFIIEVPADKRNGDFSTNAAMVNAKNFRLPPRKIAETIVSFASNEGTYFEKIEVAGPGFINFFLNDAYYADVLLDIRKAGDSYGKSDYGKGKRLNVEFVSANPTGPMHMGNARGGALGDCLAAVLEYAGYEVSREFYVNDAGNQIDKFALSLDIRYQQLFKGEDSVELPEDSYHGADIRQRAEEFAAVYGDSYLQKSEKERRKALVDFALPKNIENMKKAMEKYRINYDTWFSELTLHNGGELKDTIELLKNRGYTYEKDGALWYKNIEVQTAMLKEQGKSQEYIDKLELKDDVLVRKNGNPTYFAADIAYHRNKLEKRGFDKAIDVWGADHHGHVARMKGAMRAVGIDENRLDVLLMQLVRLVSDGNVVRMSKRTGNAITLVDLLEEVPIDAVRFMFNMQEPGSVMDFDLDLAVKQSSQNPVYYCQYAHARICSILAKLSLEGKKVCECSRKQLERLTEPEERALIAHLAALPSVIVLAAKNYDPAKVTQYATQLATLFHKYYNACRVNVDDNELMQARLFLCVCVRDTMKNVLSLLKIDAPERM